MSTGALLCLILAVLYIASSRDISARRKARREWEQLATKQRGRAQMRADQRPSYPPPPEMPAEDVQ